MGLGGAITGAASGFLSGAGWQGAVVGGLAGAFGGGDTTSLSQNVRQMTAQERERYNQLQELLMSGMGGMTPAAQEAQRESLFQDYFGAAKFGIEENARLEAGAADLSMFRRGVGSSSEARAEATQRSMNTQQALGFAAMQSRTAAGRDVLAQLASQRADQGLFLSGLNQIESARGGQISSTQTGPNTQWASMADNAINALADPESQWNQSGGWSGVGERVSGLFN